MKFHSRFKGAKPVAKKAQELLRIKTPAGAGVNVVKDREKLSQKVEVASEDLTSKQVLGEVTSRDPKELSSNLKEVTFASKDDPSKQQKMRRRLKTNRAWPTNHQALQRTATLLQKHLVSKSSKDGSIRKLIVQ